MQDVRDIEENLRVIRKLMERGQRYEAVSGRGSLLAGSFAVVAGTLMALLLPRAGLALETHQRLFVAAWTALALASVLWIGLKAVLGADTEEGRRVSKQAVAVARSVAPAYVAAAVITLALGRHDMPWLLPGCWMLLHGVAILSTAYHAPSRLVVLGWAFVVAGAAATVAARHAGSVLGLNWIMAAGFGGLHLAHGLFSLLRPLPAED